MKISEGSRGPGFSSTDFIYIPPQLAYLPSCIHCLFLSLPPFLLPTISPSCSNSNSTRSTFSCFKVTLSWSSLSLSLSILVLFTAARFSVKTGRTRSKGCRVWRRRQREAEERENQGGKRIDTRDSVNYFDEKKSLDELFLRLLKYEHAWINFYAIDSWTGDADTLKRSTRLTPVHRNKYFHVARYILALG